MTCSPAASHSQISKRLAALLIAAMAFALSVLGGVNAPSAQALGGGSAYAGSLSGGLWVGSYRLDDGRITWCAFDPDLKSPIDGGFSYSAWQRVEEHTAQRGGVLAGEHLQRLAYVLAVYGETQDAQTARAVYRLLHLHSGTGFPTPSFDALTADAAAQADALWQESAERHGPYALPTPEITPIDGGQRATVALRTARNAAGHAFSGQLRAIIDGPGVWEASGSRTLTTTADQDATVRATGTGTITVRVEQSTPAAHLLIAHPDSAEAQRVVAGGEWEPLSASSSTPVVHTFSPTAESTAQTWRQFDPATASATQLTDIVHAASSPGGDWLTPIGEAHPVAAVYRVDWYHSTRQQQPSASIPDDVQLFDSTLVTATGPGDYVATSTRVADQQGWYYPVVSFRLDDQPEELRRWFAAEFTAGFHDEREQTVVPWQPEVRTQATEIIEGQLADVITVSGNDPAQTLEISSDLWMTDSPAVAGGTESAPEDAVLVGTVTTSITGDGTVTTAGIDVPWSTFIGRRVWPTFYWSERIESTTSTVAWTGRHLLPDETIALERPSATTRTAAHVTAGASTTDEADVAGTIPTSNATEQVRLLLGFSLHRYGDAADSAPVCASTVWRQPEDQLVERTGRHISEAVTVEQPGAYGFRHRLIAEVTTSTGTSQTVVDEGACGAEAESFVASPALAATAGLPGGVPVVVTTATLLALAGVGSMLWRRTQR